MTHKTIITPEYPNGISVEYTAEEIAQQQIDAQNEAVRKQAGNLYVNRGVTGAIVNRQPFGGWRKSSVGATAKAGGENYVATLRNWNQMKHFLPMKEAANKWIKSTASLAIDRSALDVEQNIQRNRRYKKGFLVRIESGTSKDELDFLAWLKKDLGVITRLSSDSLIPGLANLVLS